MLGTNHFHIEATFDTTDSDKVSKSLHNFTKKDIYSPRLVVTLLQVFPNLFPCVYITNIKKTPKNKKFLIEPTLAESGQLYD